MNDELAKLLDSRQGMHSLCTDDQYKEIHKEVKKRYKEMRKMAGTSYQKFLSVYRFKTTLTKEEMVKFLETDTTENMDKAYNFHSSMHYYKRDHSPIAEGISFANKMFIPFERSPYEANLAEYEGNIVT